jgi:O-acetyl-ADP-ribose deacetylase (regulator of RNase III)
LDGEIHAAEELNDEIDYSFELLMKNLPEESAFVLFGKINGFSLVDIYKEILAHARKRSIEQLKIYVNSEMKRRYLLENIPAVIPLSADFLLGECAVHVATGDITTFPSDVIVNASNTRLILGSGVSGAIKKKANPSLQEEMLAIAAGGGLAAGDVAVTGSQGMPNCRLIFHAATVEGSTQTVRRAVKKCLELCQEKKIKSIAFPALGAGTGGLEMSACAVAIIEEVEKFCRNNKKTTATEIISFILWSSGDFHAFKKKLEKIV